MRESTPIEIHFEFEKLSECKEMCDTLNFAIDLEKEKEIIPLISEKGEIKVIAMTMVNGLFGV